MIICNFVGAAPAPVNHYTTTSIFSGLAASPDAAAGVGYTFLTPAGQPNVQPAAGPPLRVSDNGNLAVEDADLTQRQPRYFFAAAALLPGWNATLARLGSYFQLIPEPEETVTVTLPGGTQRTLVRVMVANLCARTAGDQLMVTQNCDGTVKDVTGPFGEMAPVLGQQVFLGTNPTQQAAFFPYFTAARLTGGFPLNIDLPLAPGLAQDGAMNAIANSYGTSLWQLASGNPVVANPNLANDIQALGVNQFARPDRLGQGLRTTSLGASYPHGANWAVDDHAANRVVAAGDINNVLWQYHWGGVIAIDGTDYITLENYARAAETSPALAPAAAGNQERLFYFQMYGAGPGHSWHEQWAPTPPHPAGKGFANPLTIVVAPTQQVGLGYFPLNNKNGYATVGAATTLTDLQRALLAGLNYATVHLNALAAQDRLADKDRLAHWRQAVGQVVNNPPLFAASARNTLLAQYVADRLAQVTSQPL